MFKLIKLSLQLFREFKHIFSFHHVGVRCLVLGLSGGDEYVLPPGHHTFPFSFVLPPSLPSSFEGGIGYVRYLVKGTIDRPWRFDDDTVRPFTVLSALDLNQQPMAGVREFNGNTSFAMLQNTFLQKYTLQFLINAC